MRPYTFRRYIRETWQQFAGIGALAFAVAYAATCTIVACTPAERATVGRAISVLGPVACQLLSLAAPDGSPAGVVCADAAQLLGPLLQLTAATSPTLTRTAATTRPCTPRRLAEVPGLKRAAEDGEYVCAEALDDAAIRRAFGTRSAP